MKKKQKMTYCSKSTSNRVIMLC